jgi:Ca2+-binding EF-hand superfamily protein
MGEPIDADTITGLLERADLDGNGSISLEEFVMVCDVTTHRYNCTQWHACSCYMLA